MKTKELIKLLKEADPTGEMHVRVGGGPIIGVDLKEGYWDGSYSYVERDEKGPYVWHESNEGYKVDVMTIDLFDFVDFFNGDYEEAKKHVVFHFVNAPEHAKKKEETFLKELRMRCEQYNDIVDEITELKKRDGL